MRVCGSHLPSTSPQRRPRRIGLLATIVGAAFSARAQETPISVEVSGASSAYDARRDDTASKIVILQEDLLKYGDTSVTEALKRVPGVTVTVSGSGRNSKLRLRGLGNGYTQVLIDGERTPAGFSIDSLSPDIIERIEVIRVAMTEFSTQATAGTINIVLKKAVKPGQRSAKFGYVHGNAVSTPDASLQLSDRRCQFSYSLAASAAGRNHPSSSARWSSKLTRAAACSARAL